MYLVYDSTTGQPLFTQAAEPAVSPDFAFIAVADGTAISPGSTVANGALVPYTPTFADAQNAASVAASAEFAGLIAAGFTFSGTLYQIDSDSQAQITAMGALALGSITDPANSPWPAGFTWIAANNSQVAMDAPTMYAFARAVAGYVSACVLNLRAIKNAIAGAADQAALTAIDVTAGYPAASA
jgi:hypothetical protein